MDMVYRCCINDRLRTIKRTVSQLLLVADTNFVCPLQKVADEVIGGAFVLTCDLEELTFWSRNYFFSFSTSYI